MSKAEREAKELMEEIEKYRDILKKEHTLKKDIDKDMKETFQQLYEELFQELRKLQKFFIENDLKRFTPQASAFLDDYKIIDEQLQNIAGNLRNWEEDKPRDYIINIGKAVQKINHPLHTITMAEYPEVKKRKKELFRLLQEILTLGRETAEITR